MKEALKHDATVVVFVHNHPSGVTQPSRADETIMQRMKDALSVVDIRVLDRLIARGEGVSSMAERGLL